MNKQMQEPEKDEWLECVNHYVKIVKNDKDTKNGEILLDRCSVRLNITYPEDFLNAYWKGGKQDGTR